MEHHQNNTAQVNTQEATLSTLTSLGASKEDCTKARVEIIKTKQALAITQSALDACLKAKKEIQAKIDAALKLGQLAQEGLTRCLKNKEVLKNKIKMCHDKRDDARTKLKECLERKKVLKKQIEACHEKRDDARKKLAACLARKKELKDKIENLQAKGLSVLHLSNNTLSQEAEAALEILRQSDSLLQKALATLSDVTADEKVMIENLIKAGAETDVAAAEEKSTDNAQADADALADQMSDSLELVLNELRTAGSDLQGASNANTAAQTQVLMLEQSIKTLFLSLSSEPPRAVA